MLPETVSSPLPELSPQDRPQPSLSPAATLVRMNPGVLSVPLSWVATTREHPHANVGDALSAFVVAVMAGLPVRRAGFDQAAERMVAVGTIGHNQRNGVLHFWGTGVDAERNPVDPAHRGYIRPPDTEFNVYALRGPRSAATFRSQGISVPDVYGDPVWVLPRIWPMTEVEKTHDLGVILHISELESADPEATAKAILKRYYIPPHLQDRIRLINTYCPATPEAMRAKIAEIVSCRRVVSTSLHGLVISETYGIPCAWFGTYGDSYGAMLDLNDPGAHIDHRMRDFYSGAGRDRLSAFLLDRARLTDWEAVMRWVDESWRPLSYDDRPLIEAFPLPLAVSAGSSVWNTPSAVIAKIPF